MSQPKRRPSAGVRGSAPLNGGFPPQQLPLFDAVPRDPSHAPGTTMRRILIGGRPIDYRFERRRRRTLSLRIDADGLLVSVPQRVSWAEIETFLNARGRWLLRHLDARARRPRPSPIRGEAGETLPIHGRSRCLVVRPGPSMVRLEADELVVSVRNDADHTGVRALIRNWFRDDVLNRLRPRAAHYAGLLGLPEPPLAISHARQQWGACSAKGVIRLSSRLAMVEPRLAEYVVAHEVAHLREMNHSARFWTLVEGLLPGSKAARKLLAEAGDALPVFIRS